MQSTVTDQSASAPPQHKALFTIVRVFVSLGLLGWILRKTDFVEMRMALNSAENNLLLLSLCLPIIGITLSVLRWRSLLQAQGHHVPLKFLFQSYLVGGFFNNFLPSTFGGDTVRAYDTWRAGYSKSSALVSVFVDRFLGLLVLLFLASLALLVPSPITENLPPLQAWAFASMGSMLIGGALLIWPPLWLRQRFQQHKHHIPAKLRNLLTALDLLRQRPDILAKTLLLSLALQINVIIYYALIAHALHFAIPFANFFLIVPITLFLMAVPISINAIGIRENAFAFFFALFGISHSAALTFALLSYGGNLLQALIGGILYMLRK